MWIFILVFCGSESERAEQNRGAGLTVKRSYEAESWNLVIWLSTTVHEPYVTLRQGNSLDMRGAVVRMNQTV